MSNSYKKHLNTMIISVSAHYMKMQINMYNFLLLMYLIISMQLCSKLLCDLLKRTEITVESVLMKL